MLVKHRAVKRRTWVVSGAVAVGLVVPTTVAVIATSGGAAAAVDSVAVSSLSPTSVTNGWGPYETNMSNGEQAAGDGSTITINGKTYASGLGVHAASKLVYALDGAYTTFTSDVGVDDEVGNRGSVTFEVWVDGVRKYASAVLAGKDAAVPVSVDVSGASTLTLVVTDGGDNNYYDHADWAGAALTLKSAATTSSATPVSSLSPTSATNGWGPYETNMSNGEQAAGDGSTITINGKTYASGLGVHAASKLVYALHGAYTTFTSDVGVDDEVGNRGSVTFEVWVDGVRKYASAVLAGKDAAVPVSVDVSGASTLTLVVTDGGDNNYYDHADWAGAALTTSGSATATSPSPSPSPSPPATTTSSPTCTGPITITQGGTYTGCWVSTDTHFAVTIATSQPVTITGSTLKGPVRLIGNSVSNVKLTVTNSRLIGTYPLRGQAGGYAIYLVGFDYADIEHNYIEHKAGIKLGNWSGTSVSHPVLVRYNYASNIDGRISNGSGGYSGTVNATFLQFDNVKNAAGVEIAWNRIENAPDQSAVEDNISIFNASGTSASPIDVHDNLVHGAFPFPSTSSSYSGGGINLGDGGGAYAVAHDNVVVATSNYGLAITGGQNMTLRNNLAVASGLFSDGSPIPAMNVGLIAWNQYSAPFGNAQVFGNTSGWYRATNSRYSVGRADWWLPDCSGSCTDTHLNNNQDAVTLSDEANAVSAWVSKAAGAGVAVGPSA